MEISQVKCSTPDFAKQNIEKLLKLFPECEGEKGIIDFDKLKQCLSSTVIEGNVERYEFTWPGKRTAKAAASAATTKTLRPCAAESVGKDGTPGGFDSQNLYIEGDNLEVLKLLQTSYANQVKMIYIDPPYNTGHDFVYRDRFSMTDKELAEIGGAIADDDENGGVLARNDSSEARYHSNWCSMIYPRLKLARNLLSKDGVILMSIDDNEVLALKQIGNEIFGEHNFIAQIIVDATPKNDPYVVSTAHEYVLVYCKNLEEIKKVVYGVRNPFYDELIKIYDAGKGDYAKIEANIKAFFKDNNLQDDNISNYKYADERGVFRTGPLDDPQSSGPKDERKNPKTGKPCATPSRGWGCSLETWNQWVENGEVLFPDDDKKLPSRKVYITTDRLDVMRAYFKIQTRKDTDMLKSLFGLEVTPFSNPKPIELIRTFIENCNDKNMTVVDFFSGSGTTAHAVIHQNSLDSGSRKVILVQIPEEIKETSGQSNKEKKITRAAIKFLTDHKLPVNLCEIAKERIRRAGKKIAEENAATAPNLDIGFRVLKLDASSLRETSATVSETTQEFANFERIKSDRSPEDLLFQMLLGTRISLSDPIETKMVGGNNVFFVSDNALVACLDPAAKMTTEFFIEIAKLKPGIAFFRDDAFADDSARTNLQQAFDQFSPTTSIKVI